MRYFLDTEFIENGETIDLISIGLVCEDGRELYYQNAECDFSQANDWVKENVLPHLEGDILSRHGQPWKTKKAIADTILGFVGWFPRKPHFGPSLKPEFWGYYADYDWVVFCQLFGKMIDLPPGFPMYCCDLKQWCSQLGNPSLPDQNTSEHHALSDARWSKQTWEFLYQRSLDCVVEGN